MNQQNTEKLNKLIKKTDFEDAHTAELVEIGVRSLSELVDDEPEVVSLKKVQELSAPACAIQKVKGPVDACALIAGEKKQLRNVALKYVGEQFIETDEDVMDANCELINCVNGRLTKSFQTRRDISEDMEPPFFRLNGSVIKGETIYATELKLAGGKVIFCIAYNTGIEGT